ncbi:hypothetical protein, partial [Vibrio harveyi]|uniref:hypothetical protein n=1 Tax=Vibrio harveyi TaxID=669 RepID=UPI003BB5C0B2
DKALAEMLGLFLLRYYFGLRPTSPARVRVQLHASHLFGKPALGVVFVVSRAFNFLLALALFTIKLPSS